MRRDGRLSGVLHILLHMAQHDGPMTSEHMAKAMSTNPVVVRRIMGGLRRHGLVVSEKGHGGGWTLSCNPSEVTLRHIYDALGSPPLLAIGNRTETPGCAVEEAVNETLGGSFRDAESLLLARLADVTLASLGVDVRGRVAARGRRKRSDEAAHARAHRPSDGGVVGTRSRSAARPSKASSDGERGAR